MNLLSHISGFLMLAFGYLLGSMPTGYLAGKWIAGIDLRLKGSGSTGATNVLRHVGKWPALIVFLLDVIKGAIPVVVARSFGLNDYWQVVAGLAALIGHIWPVWLGWKGGKAVATGLGMLLGLTWQVGIACFGIFLTVLSITRIVSLSSVISALSLPFLMLLSFQDNTFRPAFLYLGIVTTAMVIWRHRSNLKRLSKGEEPKIGQSH
ncbi:MAG: glycerol-3-phosphate 1-O-acyltransferase PlsY [Prochlorococcaceae cyanobacterium ETNP1_MAG_9]|jgi:glycerol-3-phosphate acyltransferase PlsY|nr:glycerol-3-phosphate 1-O-acyltransferase PlsY [Prochlorococcaceae cyanobacterium ETNP1_MAG_9]